MSAFIKFWYYAFYVRPWKKHCSSIFFGWVTLETLFSELNLKTSEGYLFIKNDARYFFGEIGHEGLIWLLTVHNLDFRMISTLI